MMLINKFIKALTQLCRWYNNLRGLIGCIKCPYCKLSGNALINVGPTKEGVIPPIFRERLLQMGEWLEVNGEAIYDTSPWYHQKDSLNSHVWYTCKKATYDPLRVSDVPRVNETILAIYAIFLLWPVDDILSVQDLTSYMKNNNYLIHLLGPEHYTTLDVSTCI